MITSETTTATMMLVVRVDVPLGMFDVGSMEILYHNDSLSYGSPLRAQLQSLLQFFYISVHKFFCLLESILHV